MAIQSWNIDSGEQTGGIPPHAATHHLDGGDVISAEAIGAEAAGAVGNHEAIFHANITPLLPPTRFSAPIVNPISINMALSSNWQSIFGTTARATRIDNIVMFAGIIGQQTFNSGSVVILPEGYRPSAVVFLTTWGKNSIGEFQLVRVRINPSGAVDTFASLASPVNTTNGGFVSLDGLRYIWNDSLSALEGNFGSPLPLPVSSQSWNNSGVTYRKVANKFVIIQGQPSRLAGGGKLISNLPEGFRPPYNLTFGVLYNFQSQEQLVAGIEIFTNGNIVFGPDTLGGIGWLALNVGFVLN